MKKSYIYTCILILSVFTQVFSQNPNRVSIKGIVADTTSEKMAFAYVMLLNPSDSTMLNYTRSDENGSFEFKNIKNSKYILKVSYINYLPLSTTIGPFANEINDLGKVKIKPIAKELMEVVVRTAQAPLTIKGDTIEYDARAFKVPEGSTVEDLLRRLPGLEVDAAGNIKAQGQDVRKVLVDGKTFFGDDPKAATKNLGAETISKVQVYNDKSEQAKLTGIDDGKKEKAINLELKDEFKKGKFGKVTAAIGDQSRWASKGNYNMFNKNEQFSIIGYGNNINQTGVNWDDYGEFKGNSQYQFDNGDFGFNSGFMYYWGEEGGITNNFDGRGFTKNAGAGVNYNYDNKKSKFNTSYFYKKTDLDLNTRVLGETYLANGSFFNRDSTQQNNFLGNHTFGMRYEKMIDSSNTFIAKTNIKAGQSDKLKSAIIQRFNSTNNESNSLNLGNDYNGNTLKINSTAIFNHKFKKNKARNYAISLGYNINNNNYDEIINSISKFKNAASINDQIAASKIANVTELNTSQFKSSARFMEPLSKKVFWETFYNFSIDQNKTFREGRNQLEGNRRLDSLSSYYNNNILYNRFGSSIRYSHDGKNLSFGLAGVQYNLDGDVYLDKSSSKTSSISKSYFGLTPNLNLIIEKNNIFFNIGYNYSISAPRLNDLQPVIDNSNPFAITIGNPNLTPQKAHEVNIWSQKFNPASFVYVNLNYNYKYYTSQIVYNQSFNEKFVNISRPINLSGGTTNNFGIYAGFPIIKTKITMNVNGNLGFNSNPNYINDKLNIAKGNNKNINLSINMTPTPKFFMDLATSIGINNLKNSVIAFQNQRIINNSYTASIKWNFAKKTFFESNFDNNIFRNKTFNFEQSLPIWNASIRRLFLKENKLEMRFASFDLLNKNVGIRQYSSITNVSREIAPTLARYFMASLTYNIKGHEDKLKKNNW